MKKKKWLAVKATTDNADGINHDGKKYKFGRDDTFTISDEGLKRELDRVHGAKGTQRVAISEWNDTDTDEPGHKYTFSGVKGKWKSPKGDPDYEEYAPGRFRLIPKQKRLERRKGAEVLIEQA